MGADPADQKRATRRAEAARIAAEEQEARRREDTVANVLARYYADHADGLKSGQEVRRVLDKELKGWAKRRVDDIRRSDAIRVLDTVKVRAPIQSKRLRAYGRHFFQWCITKELVEKNPFDGTAVVKEVPRDRVLTDDELRLVLRAIDRLEWPRRQFVHLLLLSAQRLNEVGDMEWSELDLIGEAPTWTLPGVRAKNGRAHAVPLAPIAVEILSTMDRVKDSPRVFASFSAAHAKTRVDEVMLEIAREDERQREANPDVWIITAASLLYEKPDFLPELDGLVIDEKFHDNAVGDQTKIDTTELWRAKIELCSDEEHDFLLGMRAKLLTAAENNGAGALSRAVLDEHGIFPHTALRAAILEQRLVKPDVLRPGMKESGFNLALHKHGARNRLAREAGALWNEIAMFLTFDHRHSGRISVAGSTFTFTPLRPFHPSWWAPMLALDATLTTPEILHATVLGDEVAGIPVAASLKADITIQWPDHVRVRRYAAGQDTREIVAGTCRTACSPFAVGKPSSRRNCPGIPNMIPI
ncbi:integrase [Bradyrhizobium sp. GM2.2]|uniref:tyrosine-type recombinase/integrase n=1 Tax=Bradyrhizobium sp. GM2.2 TaxID=3156358 RepID=UPI003395EC35